MGLLLGHDNPITPKVDTPCYFCHSPVYGQELIYWVGAGDPLFLHPECALEMSLRILRDLHEFEKRSRQRIVFTVESRANQEARMAREEAER